MVAVIYWAGVLPTLVLMIVGVVRDRSQTDGFEMLIVILLSMLAALCWPIGIFVAIWYVGHAGKPDTKPAPESAQRDVYRSGRGCPFTAGGPSSKCGNGSCAHPHQCGWGW